MNPMPPFVGPLRFLGRDLQRDLAPPDDDRVVRLIEGSAIGHLIARVRARVDGDWRRSTTRRVVCGLRDQAASLPPWQRTRTAALALLTAVIVHVGLTGFSAPEPNAVARAVWIGSGMVLVAVMAGAHHVAAAWVDWSSRGGVGHESERE